MYITAKYKNTTAKPMSTVKSIDPAKDLSPRQVQILRAIIEEYINTADPVGSATLEKKYNLGVSPATIRNEMVRLTDMKLLKQPHTSAGRVPTPFALRFYVDHLMKAKSLTVADEVSVKEKIWDFRQESDKLLREATRALAGKTKTLALTVTNSGDIYYSGAAHILDTPEFYDFQLTHHLLAALDQVDFWWRLLEGRRDQFYILLGEEIGGDATLASCGYVYSKFETPHMSGAIGIVGPSRLNYPYIVPVVRYVGRLVGEIANTWE